MRIRASSIALRAPKLDLWAILLLLLHEGLSPAGKTGTQRVIKSYPLLPQGGSGNSQMAQRDRGPMHTSLSDLGSIHT